MEINEYYTVDQASCLLGVHPVTLRKWIREGIFTAIKFGKEYRITQEALQNGYNKKVSSAKNTDSKISSIGGNVLLPRSQIIKPVAMMNCRRLPSGIEGETQKIYRLIRSFDAEEADKYWKLLEQSPDRTGDDSCSDLVAWLTDKIADVVGSDGEGVQLPFLAKDTGGAMATVFSKTEKGIHLVLHGFREVAIEGQIDDIYYLVEIQSCLEDNQYFERLQRKLEWFKGVMRLESNCIYGIACVLNGMISRSPFPVTDILIWEIDVAIIRR